MKFLGRFQSDDNNNCDTKNDDKKNDNTNYKDTKEPRTFVAPKKKTVCSCKGVGGFEVQMLEISVDFEI